MPMNIEYAHRVGISAAYKSGKIIRSFFGRLKQVEKKGAIDLVTEADLASEKAILKIIGEKFPDHSVLAEESGEKQQNSPFKWIIDPLDGTTNFTHQLGIFAVSIAFAIDNRIEFGIILNPISGELFTARSKQGAFLNGRPIKVSSVKQVSESLLVTGFPYDFADHMDVLAPRFQNCLMASQGVRRLGAASLDLCFVACGRFEGFWEQNLKPWDTAAGIIIAEEAGARITDFSNRPFSVDKKEILTTNSLIHDEMISLLKL
ncbi:inositol monophosphatase family protein [Desulfobacterales bacterium HSG16]|nr:inositol monophosphatase family protein [Desulfobacterales bacterium HSG16]